METHLYQIVPVAKPRMTQRDKWAKRPIVQRYMAYKDMIRFLKVKVPEAGAHVIFCMPMPKSWSKKKKKAMRHHPHQQVPDVDNLQKALMDATYEDDSIIWNITTTKIWADTGQIAVLHHMDMDKIIELVLYGMSFGR